MDDYRPIWSQEQDLQMEIERLQSELDGANQETEQARAWARAWKEKAKWKAFELEMDDKQLGAVYISIRDEKRRAEKAEAEIERLRTLLAEAVEVIKEIEWSSFSAAGDRTCPGCYNKDYQHKHEDWCKLAVLLAQARGE